MPPPGQPKLYRCMNPDCPADTDVFEGTAAVCPACTAGKHDPRAVVEISPVHYLVNVPPEGAPIRTGAGGRQVACKPTANRIPKHATGVAEAVTCPKCRGTAVWKEHVENEVDQSVLMIQPVMLGQPSPVSNVTKVGE